MLRLTLTLESDEQYHRWLDEISAVCEGQSHWICAMVEHALVNPRDLGTALELQRLREEINELKAEKSCLRSLCKKSDLKFLSSRLSLLHERQNSILQPS